MRRRFVLVAVTLLSALAGGCSTTSDPEALAQNDPYEPTNRAVFEMNTKVDHAVARPVAIFYNHAFPGLVRDCVHNALANLDKPVVFGNDALQGDGMRANQTLARFLVNSTLGIAGLFDVASQIGLSDHSEDFGQTLGVWGAGEGSYLVLPFMGPSSPRDLAGDAVDIGMDPLTYISFHGSDTLYAVRSGADILDLRARNVDTVDQIERTSIDFYATTRSLYRQYRNSEIRNGAPDVQDIPDTPDP
jgi:phospholipid-binding lipoprotein MlaA